MPTLTIKNIPAKLHRHLTVQARRRHRSLNSEVIACLEQMVGTYQVDVASTLATARALRMRQEAPVDHDEITQIKHLGRP